jgi:hypothetical protein
LVGLSPLLSPHPSGFQPTLVRTSMRFYPHFILDKSRSPGFASTARYLIAHLGLAFTSATLLKRLTLQRTSNSLAHYPEGTLSSIYLQANIQTPTVCKHTVSGTISPSYKECFSPFPHGTGSLSVTRKYLVLGDGSPGFPQNSTYSVVLGNTLKELYCFHLRDYHPLWLNFPEYSVNKIVFYSSVYQQFNQNVPRDTANTRVAAFNMLDGLDYFPFARRY